MKKMSRQSHAILVSSTEIDQKFSDLNGLNKQFMKTHQSGRTPKLQNLTGPNIQ
jgi:hypothetical protein